MKVVAASDRAAAAFRPEIERLIRRASTPCASCYITGTSGLDEGQLSAILAAYGDVESIKMIGSHRRNSPFGHSAIANIRLHSPIPERLAYVADDIPYILCIGHRKNASELKTERTPPAPQPPVPGEDPAPQPLTGQQSPALELLAAAARPPESPSNPRDVSSLLPPSSSSSSSSSSAAAAAATTSETAAATPAAAALSYSRAAQSTGRGQPQVRRLATGRSPSSNSGHRPAASDTSIATDAPQPRQDRPATPPAPRSEPDLFETLHRGATRSRSPSLSSLQSQDSTSPPSTTTKKPKLGAAAGSPPAGLTERILLVTKRQSRTPRPPADGGISQH